MRVRPPILIPLIAFLALGCDDPGTAARPPEWRLAAVPMVEVGAMEPGGSRADAMMTFSRIVGAVALPDGRYVVADAGEARLLVVTADGAFEAVVGGAGEGPGEFDQISKLWATPGGGWAVWDSGLRRVTRFRPDGSVLDSHPVIFGPEGSPIAGGSLDQGQGGLADGRFVLAWIVAGGVGDPDGPPRNTPLADRMMFGLFGPEGGFERLVGEEGGMVRYYSDAGGGPLPLSPFPWAALVGDTLVTTSGAPSELRFFALSGRAETTAGGRAGPPEPARRLPLDRRPPARAAAWSVLSDAAAAGRVPEPWATRLARIDRDVGPIPALGRLLADDEGRLWVKTYDPGRDALALGGGPFRTGGEWTVLAADGTEVARLTLPDDLAPLAVTGERMLALGRDALDVERFIVVRIER